MLACHVIVCKHFPHALKPETILPDGYDYPQFVDEEMEVQRGELTAPNLRASIKFTYSSNQLPINDIKI